MKRLISTLIILMLIFNFFSCSFADWGGSNSDEGNSGSENVGEAGGNSGSENGESSPESTEIPIGGQINPNYRLKEIESIVLDTKGHPVGEAVEGFYQDPYYSYFFMTMVSEYITVTYKDGSSEKVKDALANMHIKIEDLDRFGIEYHKTPGNIACIVDTTISADDKLERFWVDEEYYYVFPSVKSHNITVYYKDGSCEGLIDALVAGRISVSLLDWYSIGYIKEARLPNLSLYRLKSLTVKHGESLSGEHLVGKYHYDAREGGILEYPIDYNFKLVCGYEGGEEYIRLVSLSCEDDFIDLRYENIDDFLDGSDYIIDLPENFSFSLVWGVYGICSYDSESGRLVKEKNDPDKYSTVHILRPWEKVCIFRLLMDLGASYYPDEYDPTGLPPSSPSQTIILNILIGDMEKRIEAIDISLFTAGADEEGRAFLDCVEAITQILQSTDEWQALPDYENLYE